MKSLKGNRMDRSEETFSPAVLQETPFQEAAPLEAIILDIQRMSTEDGPGLRTTVFFKGCNLLCPWCHNPESIRHKPDLVWYPNKCRGCNICQDVCPQKGISRGTEGLQFNKALCLACGTCVENCPNAAIEIKGRTVTVDKLAQELIKDRAYFGKDGGITLSGGEVMSQHDAVLSLAKLLEKTGVNIAVDTAGCYDYHLLETMLPYINLVLFDIKIFNNESHKRLIGVDNRLILDNYRMLMRRKARVWVRTPIIENATDSLDNIADIGKFIASTGLPEKWELCAFNNLCKDKYKRLDLDWAYKDTELTKKAHIEKLLETALRYVPVAEYSGRVQDPDGLVEETQIKGSSH